MTTPPTNRGRPWSVAEIEAMIPTAYERLEECAQELKSLGARSAELTWEYERREAIARVHVRAKLEGEKSAAEDRKALATLHVFEDGTDLAEWGMSRDLAKNAYADQRKILDAADTELKVLQTLHVSARKMP